MVNELNGLGADSPESTRQNLDKINTTIRQLQQTIQENTRSLTTITNLLTSSRDNLINFIPSLMPTGLQSNTDDSNNYLPTASNANSIFPSLTTSLSNTVNNSMASLWNIFLPRRETARTQDNSSTTDSKNLNNESGGIISTILNLSAIQKTLDSFNAWESNMWASQNAVQAQRDQDRRAEEEIQAQAQRDEERRTEEHRQEELATARRNEERRTEEHRQEELATARRDEERRAENSRHAV